MNLPESQETESHPPLAPGHLVGWGLLTVVIGVAVAAFVGYRVPVFAAMFSGFGPILPVPTQLVSSGWYVLWLMPAVALVVFLVGSRRPGVASQRRTVMLLAILSAVTMLLGVLAMAALYIPLCCLGQPI
jgi:ABC-type Co2+ transport system permease subunit